MSIERFRELLDQMPGLEALHLQGLGEPMLHPRFFEMVSIAAERGIRVSTNSNLTLLTEKRARRCISSGLASISVSLDGASAAVYESVRRRASFAKVLRNLGRLVDARDAAGSVLAVRGVMVLMRANLDELPALVCLLHEHRVHELLAQRLSSDLDDPGLPARYIAIRSFVRDAELQRGDLAHARQVFDDARRTATRLGVRLHLPRLPGDAEQTAAHRVDGPRCGWPWEQLYITAAGELLPCCMVATADRASFGKVFDDSAGPAQLSERWHGEAAQAFRTALASDDPPHVCRSCALYRGHF
jgi:radical SAM protein with 4Fe4S-binding SPASM domain